MDITFQHDEALMELRFVGLKPQAAILLMSSSHISQEKMPPPDAEVFERVNRVDAPMRRIKQPTLGY